MKTLFLLISFVLLAAEAQATRYWADSGGSGSAVCTDIDGAGDPTPNYGTIARAVACATASGDEVYIKPGTYTGTSPYILNPTSGITIRGSDSTYANWPILRPTTLTQSWRIVTFTASRSDVTFRYLFFDLNSAAGITSAQSGACGQATTGITTTNIIFEHFRCRGPSPSTPSRSNGFQIPKDSSYWTVRYGTIEQFQGGASPWSHGLYVAANNSTFEHLTITDYDGFCGQIYNSGVTQITNITVRYNYCRPVQTGLGARNGFLVQHESLGTLIHNNIITDFAGYGIRLAGTNTQIFNNTIYNTSSVNGITIAACNGACPIANNLIVVGGTSVSGSDAEVTQTTNSTASACMIDAAGGDYNLVELSACIDGGTVVAASGVWPGHSGRYVGAGVDIGAFEAPIRLSAAVENATPTIYSTTYSMPSQSVRDGAGLLTCTYTNWAMVVAGGAATENSCLTTAATNRVDVTLNAAVTNGQSLTDAFTRSAVPTLTDSVGIGDPNGTLWTNFFNAKVRNHTAASGTNNVGGVASVLTSIHFRCLSWYSDTTPAATDWLHAEDASGSTLPCRVKAGGFAAVAIAIQNTTTAQTTGLDWHFNRNGGGYAALSNTATSTAIAFAGVNAPSMSDTEAISTTILTMPDSYIAGKVIAQAASQPVVAFTADSTTNAIILVKTDAATAVGDTYCIQAAKSGGAVSSVTQIAYPCLLITNPASGY